MFAVACVLVVVGCGSPEEGSASNKERIEELPTDVSQPQSVEVVAVRRDGVIRISFLGLQESEKVIDFLLHRSTPYAVPLSGVSRPLLAFFTLFYHNFA